MDMEHSTHVLEFFRTFMHTEQRQLVTNGKPIQ